MTRDRMGEKPFFIDDGKRFIFASEQKALLPFIDESSIKKLPIIEKNSYFYEYNQYIVRRNFKITCCSLWIYKDGRLTIRRYWAPLENLNHLPCDYSEQVDALRELLIDSCKLRLRSDVSVATGLVVVLIPVQLLHESELGRQPSVQRLPNDWQNAFVASFPEPLWMNLLQHRELLIIWH